MGLQALLQKRAQLVAEQESLIANNEKGITEDTEKRFNEIQDEIKGLNAKIEMYRVVEDNKKSGVTATGQSVTGEGPTIILDPVKDTEKDNCGFASLGEFLHAVKYGDKKGRLEHAKSQNTYEGEDGIRKMRTFPSISYFTFARKGFFEIHKKFTFEGAIHQKRAYRFRAEIFARVPKPRDSLRSLAPGYFLSPRFGLFLP